MPEVQLRERAQAELQRSPTPRSGDSIEAQIIGSVRTLRFNGAPLRGVGIDAAVRDTQKAFYELQRSPTPRSGDSSPSTSATSARPPLQRSPTPRSGDRSISRRASSLTRGFNGAPLRGVGIEVSVPLSTFGTSRLQRSPTPRSGDRVASLSSQDQAFHQHLASGWQEMTLASEAT